MPTYKIIKLDSVESLQNYILDNKVLEIGDEDEKNRYEIITTSYDEVICIISYYFLGIEPQIMDFNDKLYIGTNERFYCINKKTKNINYETPLRSVFYEFRLIRESSFIVIFAELEMRILDLSGQILFQTNFTDIVCDFDVNDSFITIETEEDGILIYEIDKFINTDTIKK